MTQAELYTLLKTSDLTCGLQSFQEGSEASVHLLHLQRLAGFFGRQHQLFHPVGMFDIELYTVEKDPYDRGGVEKIFNHNRLLTTRPRPSHRVREHAEGHLYDRSKQWLIKSALDLRKSISQSKGETAGSYSEPVPVPWCCVHEFDPTGHQ